MNYFTKLLKILSSNSEQNRKERILAGLPLELQCDFAVNLLSHKNDIIQWFKNKGLNPCLVVDTSRMEVRRFTLRPQLNIRFYVKDCEVRMDGSLDEGEYDFYFSNDFYEKFIQEK